MSQQKLESRSLASYTGLNNFQENDYAALRAKFENQGEIQYPFEDTSGTGDENKIRGNWTSKGDFFALCLGFSVGLNNFWRFPYYFYIHGGTTFLLPYLIMLCLIGLPIYFMELAIGQFASVGCITVWKLCPMFKGVGIAMFIISVFIAIYHNVIIAWSVYYFINSLQSDVPWKSCDHYPEWNTLNCTIVSRQLFQTCSVSNGTLLTNGTCVLREIDHKNIVGPVLSESHVQTLPSYAPYSVWPSSEFFHHAMLHLSGDIASVGAIHWQLALYSFLAWIFVFFSLFKGIKSAGKVAYVTTILPYVILFVFLVRAMWYEGAINGVVEFIMPDYTKLLTLKIWGDAALQSFYSLCCSWGALTTLASYNKFHTNCYKQSWMLCFSDVISAIFFGVVVFATMGALAYETNAPEISALVQKDYGIAYVIFSESIARSSLAPIWSVLFYSMLILLSIDTQFVVMETIVVGLCDEFPEFLRKYHRHVLALCAVIFYAFGVPFCTKAGLYAILIFENYLATWSLLIIAFVECMALAWVYDVDNLLDNIKWMIGYYPAPYIFWKLLWLLVTPTMLILVLTYAWIFHESGHYVNYPFPRWADTTGWILSFMAVSAIPLTVLVKFILQRGSLAQRFRSLLTPDDDWGPALAIYRSEQYPLQIPEARDPLKLPWIVTARDRGTPVPSAVDDTMKPFMSDENEQKRFERETVI